MNETNYLLAAISALVAVIGVLAKVISALYKKADYRGEQLIAFAERMLKGEFCENCKKSL